MSDRQYRVGADDPAMGRDVAEAYDRKVAAGASPGSARIGAALGNVVALIGLMAGVCVLLGLAWVAVRLTEAL